MKTSAVYGIEMPEKLTDKDQDHRTHGMSMNITAGCKVCGHACDSGIQLQLWNGRTEIAIFADSFSQLRWLLDSWKGIIDTMEAEAFREPAEVEAAPLPAL